jgi:predicted HAD superfamily phosphohydrolase
MNLKPNRNCPLRQTAAALLALTCLALLAGCQLPNVGPFVDATGQLKSAVAVSGTVVEQELRLIPGAEDFAQQLKTNWVARDKAMTALLAYAESLDSVVAAGKSGAESAGKIADSVAGLAEAAGMAIPGSPAALAVANDTVKFLAAQVANIRAAKQLARAFTEAQPAVEKIAQLMRQDLDDLDGIVQAANQIIETDVVAARSESRLLDQRKAILEQMKRERDLAKKEDRDELVQLSQLLVDVEARDAVYQAKLDVGAERLRVARQLIGAANAALDAWLIGHQQLAVAARNKTTVSTRALLDSAVELRDLVKRMREL